ncbi:MAG: NifU family protein [Candidatus Kerfeldbacteria bacterium]|nr:NifU family protein [Candidatus Kerfeldbacteria bacterium]
MSREQVENKIKKVIADLEPYVAGHGGSIILASWDEETGQVKVSLEGACEHCALSQITLKFGLEEALKKALPQVREVVAV